MSEHQVIRGQNGNQS